MAQRLETQRIIRILRSVLLAGVIVAIIAVVVLVSMLFALRPFVQGID
jgi:hypothetical protein